MNSLNKIGFFKDIYTEQKCIFLLINIISLFVFEKLINYILYTIFFLSLFIVFKLINRKRIKLIIISIIFILFSVLPIIFVFDDKNAIFNIFSLYITKYSLAIATLTLFKTMAMMLNIYFFIFTTTINEILLFFEKIKVPKLVTSLMFLTYHLIFILIEETTTIKKSQEIRLGYQTYILSLKSFAALASSTFAKAMRKTTNLQLAMETRLFDGYIHTIEQTQRLSKLYYLLYLISFCIIFFLNGVLVWN